MPERLVRHGSAPYGTVSLDVLDRHIIQFLRSRRPPQLRRHRAAGARVGTHCAQTRRPPGTDRRDLRRGSRQSRLRSALPSTPWSAYGSSAARVQSVGSRLAAMDNVAYVGYMTGGFDIFIEVFLPDTEGLFTFLNTDLAAIEEITHAEAWHVLRTEKFSYTWEGETVPSGLRHRQSQDEHAAPHRRHPTRSVNDHEAAPQQVRNSTSHGLRVPPFVSDDARHPAAPPRPLTKKRASRVCPREPPRAVRGRRAAGASSAASTASPISSVVEVPPRSGVRTRAPR